MIGAQETEALCQLLERQERLATAHVDARAYPAGAAFLRFIETQPQFADLLRELVVESRSIRNSHIAFCANLVGELESWCQHQREGEHEATVLDANVQFLAELAGCFSDSVSADTSWEGCGLVERAFDSLLESIADARAGDEAGRESLKMSRRQLQRLQRLYRRARIVVRSNGEVIGGEAYEALREHATVLFPPILVAHDERDDVYEPHMSRAEKLLSLIRDAEAFPPTGSEIEGQVVCTLVRRISVALQTMLVRRRTLNSLVRRFAARCESFEAKRIRESAPAGRVETALTLEFARYLFDAGYNPVLNPEVSGLKPDVVHVSNLPALYVEVKQYDGATLSSLRSAVAQTRQTWQVFANRFDTPEAVLLVFRLGGRSIELPQALPFPAGRMLVQVVDVAPPEESGSRAAVPLRISEAELLDND